MNNKPTILYKKVMEGFGKDLNISSPTGISTGFGLTNKKLLTANTAAINAFLNNNSIVLLYPE